MENPNLTVVPINHTTTTIMENISAIEGNSSFRVRSENSSMPFHAVFLYILPYLAGHHSPLAEFEVFVKSAFVYWYHKQIRREVTYFKMHYEILLLVICFQSAVGKDTDVCGLSLVWSCYLLVSYLIRGRVWISILVLYVATLVLLARIPNYFSHLAFIVDVLAIYTMNCYIAVGNRNRSVSFIHYLWFGLLVAACFGLLYNTPSPSMDDLNLLYMMLVSIIGCAIDLEKVYSRPVFITCVLGYCLYIKNKYIYSDVTE